MRSRILMIFAAGLLLAACETAGEETSEASGVGAVSTGVIVEETEIASVVPGSQEDLLLNVGDRIFFGFDSSELDSNSQDVLKNLAAWLQANPGTTITIAGHADNRGTREYNLALGERRANSARDFLVALGINPSRVGTISYGKERPAVLGDFDEAWAQNRRDVFEVNG
ncbi:MAG: peptidoglycan-associated lipoprotein Pal [Pseudomonadota bacterium]